MKILFVDDETKVLRGIENGLFDYEDLWEMTFTDSPLQAQTILSERNVNVLVSDIQMGELDGATLINQAKQKYPDLYCIALSGEPSRKKLNELLVNCDSILSKPCDIGRLIDTLTLAENLLKTGKHNEYENIDN
jgi:DNA-binding NtrC family response regulator